MTCISPSLLTLPLIRFKGRFKMQTAAFAISHIPNLTARESALCSNLLQEYSYEENKAQWAWTAANLTRYLKSLISQLRRQPLKIRPSCQEEGLFQFSRPFKQRPSSTFQSFLLFPPLGEHKCAAGPCYRSARTDGRDAWRRWWPFIRWRMSRCNREGNFLSAQSLCLENITSASAWVAIPSFQGTALLIFRDAPERVR